MHGTCGVRGGGSLLPVLEDVFLAENDFGGNFAYIVVWRGSSSLKPSMQWIFGDQPKTRHVMWLSVQKNYFLSK